MYHGNSRQTAVRGLVLVKWRAALIHLLTKAKELTTKYQRPGRGREGSLPTGDSGTWPQQTLTQASSFLNLNNF